jgi:hypothetical protein
MPATRCCRPTVWWRQQAAAVPRSRCGPVNAEMADTFGCNCRINAIGCSELALAVTTCRAKPRPGGAICDRTALWSWRPAATAPVLLHVAPAAAHGGPPTGRLRVDFRRGNCDQESSLLGWTWRAWCYPCVTRSQI